MCQMKKVTRDSLQFPFHMLSWIRREGEIRMNKPYFPLFVDISQKEILVVGGGRVAERRVRTLLSFAEHIKVVSPKLTEELHGFVKCGQIIWVQKTYSYEMLDGAYMVLAATDDAACNEQIVKDCRSRGILVNTSHRKELCDFYFPAVAARGNVAVGITASGLSHRQARETREKIEKVLKNMERSGGQHE